jgi:phage regulator Rha-like protein
MNQSELFPETLLIKVSEGRIYTTSRMVAEHFHKQHKHVLRDIDKLISECAALDFGGPDLGHQTASLGNFGSSNLRSQTLNFEEQTYTYQSGRNHTREARMFKMDRKAFCVLVGRFSGHYALRWQLSYHDAFEAMERDLAAVKAELMQMKEREAAALYAIRPRWKPIVEHPDFKRAALISLTGHKSPASITACRRRMRQVGLIERRAS